MILTIFRCLMLRRTSHSAMKLFNAPQCSRSKILIATINLLSLSPSCLRTPLYTVPNAPYPIKFIEENPFVASRRVLYDKFGNFFERIGTIGCLAFLFWLKRYNNISKITSKTNPKNPQTTKIIDLFLLFMFSTSQLGNFNIDEPPQILLFPIMESPLPLLKTPPMGTSPTRLLCDKSRI